MIVALVALVGATISARAETAPVKCTTGYQNIADICVSQRMADYLACLRELKGGRLRVTGEHSDSTPSGLIVEVGGGVRGIASGRVKIDTKQEKKTTDKLEETFSPDGVSGCIKNAGTPPSSGRPPGKHHSPPEREKAPRTAVDPTEQEIRLLLQQGADQEKVGTPASLQAARTLYSSAYETSGRKSAEAAGSLGLVFGRLCDITSLKEYVTYCETSSYVLQKALDDATDPWVKRHRGTLEDAKERVNKAPSRTESEHDKVRSLIENGRDQEFRGFDAAAADLYRRALDTSRRESAEAAGLLGLVQTKLCGALKGSGRHRCFAEAASHLKDALYRVNADQWVTGSQSLLQETWEWARGESEKSRFSLSPWWWRGAATAGGLAAIATPLAFGKSNRVYDRLVKDTCPPNTCTSTEIERQIADSHVRAWDAWRWVIGGAAVGFTALAALAYIYREVPSLEESRTASADPPWVWRF